MILNFVNTLKCLYTQHPDGCLCIEYKYICKPYPHYPFCKLDIENIINDIDKNCHKENLGMPADICFFLTKDNLDKICNFLKEFKSETFYGSIVYYDCKESLLFYANTFIDDVMEPEDMMDSVGIVECLAKSIGVEV